MLCASCNNDIVETTTCPDCGGPADLDARYRLLSAVGHGAHGFTYRALRLDDQRVVAIKELVIRKLESAKALELFEREAAVLQQLDYSGIPDFIESFCVEAGRSLNLYLVQEFIGGQTLAQEAATHRYTEDEILRLLADVLDVLTYLAALRPPVVHRDLKPGNIMRRADGSIVLIDFGSVRAAMDSLQGGSTVAGTFGYMAPEQLMGRALPATDLYGLGATALALLARCEPQELLAPDRQLHFVDRLQLSPEMSALLQWMLEPEPEQRPQDTAELARQVRARLAGDSTALALPSSRALLPPAPREVPEFIQKGTGTARFQIAFGRLLAGMGGGAAVANLIAWLFTGALVPVILGPVFLAVFGGIGRAFLLTGLRTRNRQVEVYHLGHHAKARITDISLSMVRMNKRNPFVYTYAYDVDGVTYSDSYSSLDRLPLNRGDSVPILYLPANPEHSMLLEDALERDR